MAFPTCRLWLFSLLLLALFLTCGGKILPNGSYREESRSTLQEAPSSSPTPNARGSESNGSREDGSSSKSNSSSGGGEGGDKSSTREDEGSGTATKTALTTTGPSVWKELTHPDVFIIGAQRAGVSTLDNVLLRHPHVCNKGAHEKHYFSEKDYQRKREMYEEEYADCKSDQLTFDATPKYIFGTEIAERINRSYTRESLSSKKFIAILREPVSRQYSEYQRLLRVCFRSIDENNRTPSPQTKRGSTQSANQRKKDKNKSNPECAKILHFAPTKHPTKFPEPLTKEKAMVLFEWTGTEHGEHEKGRGNYLRQLEHWLKIVRRKQLFIVNFDTLIKNATDTLFRVSAFLGLNADLIINDKKNKRIVLPPPPSMSEYVNWPPAVLDCRTHAELEKYYRNNNDGLMQFINSAKDKPAEEPDFPPFDTTSTKCKDV